MHEAFGVGPLQVFVSHSWHGGIFHLKRGVNRGWPEMHQRRNLYCCPLNGFSCGLLLVFRKDFGMFFFLVWEEIWRENQPKSTIMRVLTLWSTPPKFTKWWFQTFFMFTPTWGNDPIWLIFFRWVETTNQKKQCFQLFPAFWGSCNLALSSNPFSCWWGLLANPQNLDLDEFLGGDLTETPSLGERKVSFGRLPSGNLT